MSSLYDTPAGSCTAQLVVSESEAYVAFSDDRRPRGPNGEPRIARLLHTTDGGLTWEATPWRRSLLSRLRYPGFPNWPPEAVIDIALEPEGLTITHRDEHVIFEPGGESLWKSTFRGSAWSVRKVRLMDYERRDHALSIPKVALTLPPSIRPPNQALQPTDAPSARRG
jgi:hypothetical protein